MNTDQWMQRLSRCNSHERISTLRRIWRFIPESERASALAEAISCGDLMAPHLAWLCDALIGLRRNGVRVFDGERARAEFGQLPERLTIYRGTVEAEGWMYGVSWTLNRERAEWFATKHGRFRNTDSSPVVLQTEIAKTDVSGYLVERNEAEILAAVDVIARSRPVTHHLARSQT